MIKGASRRNPVQGRSAQAVAAVAASAGVLVALSGAHPTGTSAIDFILIVGAVAACVWAAASAPWWAITALSAVSVALAASIAWTALGLVALSLSAIIGYRRLNWAWVRSLAVGMCAQVLAHLDIRALFGVTAAIAVGVMATIFVIGAWRRPSKIRRRAIRVVSAVGGLLIVAAVGLAVAAISARSTVKTGTAQARSGLSLLTAGDVDEARAAFQGAADSFRDAADNLGKPWTQPARLVPILAQNRNSAEDLATAATDAADSIDLILAQLDFDSVKLVDGRFDLDAIRSLEQPLTQLTSVLGDLTEASERADSPWLIGEIKDGLDDLNRDLASQRSKGDDALRAVRLAPDMLGGSGKRIYFIAFCTPAEARGSLGFMGNFAELTADNGKLSITRFGRTTADLNPGGDPENRTITGLDEFMTNYGGFGFNTGPGGTAGSDVWQIVTISRDFPTTAQLISQLYPQSGGQPVDGVFALDPAALASLLQITGPLAVDGRAEPLTTDNAEQYLLLDQYRDAASFDDRVDSLESLADAVTNRLLAGSLPEPRALAKIFGPLARENHLVAWAADEDEEQLFEQFKADGALPELEGRDGIGFAVNNASASKIDTFLNSSLDYDALGDGTASATLTLTNTAPSEGLPDYVIGNSEDLPRGTSRVLVTIYSARPAESMTIEDIEVTFEQRREKGWYSYTQFVDLPPGGTKSVAVKFASASTPTSVPVLVYPALAIPAMIAVAGNP